MLLLLVPPEVMVMLVRRARLFRIPRVLEVEDVPHVRNYRKDDGGNVGDCCQLVKGGNGQLSGSMGGREFGDEGEGRREETTTRRLAG